MNSSSSTCVFVGSREDAARAYSRLVAEGIRADIVEEPGSSIPYAMGGSNIANVHVRSVDADRAKEVLMEMDFE
jgi:hypothetical protein